MKKNIRILSIICTLFIVTYTSAQQTVTIGSGINTTFSLPVNTYYNYSYTQQIFYSDEIGYSGDIIKIRFYMVGGVSFPNSTNWVIYMGHTSKTYFSSTTDWVPYSSLSQVYSGTVSSNPSEGWYEITLDTPFSYNDAYNLVIATDENKSGYDYDGGFIEYCRIFQPATSNRAITYYSDGVNPNPASPPTAFMRYAYINQLQMDIMTGPYNPTGFTAVSGGTTDIDLSWALNANGDSVVIASNTSNTFGTPVNSTVYEVNDAISGGGTIIYKGTGTAYNHSGLNHSTNYYYKAFSLNDDGEYSDGIAAFAQTDCDKVSVFPWTETFEDNPGSRVCWTQIQESGSALWSFAGGSSGGSIATAYQGAKNARFISQPGTNSPVTKLLTPQLDLTSMTTPYLNFYYAQEAFSGNQNQLKVYYRVSPSDSWVQLAQYTTNVSSWTLAELVLPNPSATYQIAFEGINNNGFANVIDNVKIFQPADMEVASVTTTQPFTSDVTIGTQKNFIIGVQVETTGTLNPLPATAFTFSTTGSTDAGDIKSAQLWSSGADSDYNNAVKLGDAYSNPNGSFTINSGTGFPLTLAEGVNYFWLSYALQVDATAENVIDAQCNSITIDGNAEVPDVQSPAGSRTIKTVTAAVFVYASTGTDFATYNKLSEAIAAINNGTHKGSIAIYINGDITETATVTLNYSGSGAASYTDIAMYPFNGNRVISASLSDALLAFNGADNVTIDGLNSGGSSLTFRNQSTNAYASTLRFYYDACNNAVTNCTIEGSSARSDGGTIFFSTANTSGNDNNTISNCNIAPYSTNYPYRAVYSEGSSSINNDGNSILDCNIYNYFNSGGIDAGIYISYNNSAWTISGNSLYQTVSRSKTTSVTYGIYINSGDDYIIEGNFIGGSASEAGGTPMTYTNAMQMMYGIFMDGSSVGTSNVNSIQGNIISNISFTSSSSSMGFTGIRAGKGIYNIGNVSGNVIGAASGTGSIYYYGSGGSTTYHTLYGIDVYNASVSTTANFISNNTIGSITMWTPYSEFVGIRSTASNVLGRIENNIIGNATTANSVHLTNETPNNSVFTGMTISTTTSGDRIINDNIIANLTIASNQASSYYATSYGIYLIGSGFTVSNNKIYSLKTGHIYSTSNTLEYFGPLSGIALSHSSGENIVRGNEIYDLHCTNTSGTVYHGMSGIYKSNNTGSTAIIENNLVYGLRSDATSAFFIRGINTIYGTTTIRNNIVLLGIDKDGNSLNRNDRFRGIEVNGTNPNDANVYFNTVFIGGTGTTGTQDSYAFMLTSTPSAESIKNNVFCNSRTNSGGSGSHYAISVADNALSDINYNNYFANGTGGVLGRISAVNKSNISDWKTATGKDNNSLNTNPLFVNQGGIQAADYYTGAYLAGITVSGITSDYNGISRPATPVMGALESFLWTGSNSNSFTNASNWTGGAVPPSGASIIFAPNPANHCLLQADFIAAGIINTQPTYNLNLNGYNLSVSGEFSLSGGALIDASTSGSVLTLNGTTSQVIPQGAFTNDEIYNLTVDNSSDVSLNSDLTILNNLTINDNAIFNVSAGKKLTVEGTLTNLEGAEGFVLKADATGTSSLLHHSPNVKATVQKYLSANTYGWTVCSPVKTADNAIFSGHINTYFYNPLLPGWAVFSSGNMENMLGYWTKFDNNKTVEFGDTLNEGVLVNSNLFRTAFGSGNFGWNFIGNPYPSAIDWNQVVALTENGSGYAGFLNATRLNSSIYVSNNDGGYNSYVNGMGTGGFDGVIPAATSFFIQVNKNYINASSPVDDAKLTFKNEVRIHETQDSKAANQQNVVSLRLTNGVYSDETLISFKPGASSAFDPAFDALKMFADNKVLPQVYSLYNDEKMSINCLDENFNDLVTMPLGIFSETEGNYVLFSDLSGIDKNINIYLEDLSKNKIHDLKTIPEYHFEFINNEDNNRFLLHFSKNVAAMEKPEEGILFTNVYAVNSTLFAESCDDNTLLKVYDLQGRVIYNAYLYKGLSKHDLNISKGFYLVTLIQGDKILTKKILFK